MATYYIQIKLEKQAQILRKSGEPFNVLVKRLDQWLEVHRSKLFEILSCVDSTQEGYVTYEEFKSSMFHET